MVARRALDIMRAETHHPLTVEQMLDVARQATLQ
jgi:hypothetical protein